MAHASHRADVLAADLGELLEAPRWHTTRQCISLVDIPTGRLIEISPGSHRVTEHHTGVAPLGAALPIGHSGYLLVGAEGIWKWSPDDPPGRIVRWAAIPPQRGIVSNDAILHDGAVWVGRMDAGAAPGAGSLWRITPEKAVPIATGLTLPNGLVPASDGRALLFAESSAERIYRVALDAEKGNSKNLEPFLETPGWTPDGLARDPLGHLWVARWGEGLVTRVRTRTTPPMDVIVPTPQTTAAAFDTDGNMYITTGREDLTAEQRILDPLAGSVFFVSRPPTPTQ